MTATQTAPVGLLTASARRTRIELLRFRRTREQVIFTFALPIVLYILLATVLDGEIGGTGVQFSSYLLAGGIGVPARRFVVPSDLSSASIGARSATPMPPAAYILGKLGYVLVVAVMQTLALIAVGVVVFGADLPSGEGWITLTWVLLLGLTSAFLLGIAISTLVTNPRSASSVVNFPFIILQFISGIRFIFSDLPTWLQNVASIFPLRWMALGMRASFLPDSFAAAEPGGSWQLDTVALMLGAWTVVGLGFVLTRFRLRTER